MSCRLILIKKLLLLRTGTPMFGVGLGLGLRGFGEGVGCPGIGGARVSWPLMEVRVPSNPQSGTLQQGLRKSGISLHWAGRSLYLGHLLNTNFKSCKINLFFEKYVLRHIPILCALDKILHLGLNGIPIYFLLCLI